MLQDYADIVPLFMTIASLSMVILEWIALTVVQKVERHQEGVVNVVSAALNFLPLFALNILLMTAFMFWVYQFRIFDLGFEWYIWGLAYIAYDMMSFVIHWVGHKVRFFWCIHSTHHSAKEMKASVAFRGSFAEFILMPHVIIWLPILGFHPLLLVIVEGFALLYGVPLHLSEHFSPKLKQTWIRKIFITPSAHRLHHAKNGIYLDTNYGLTFSIWDNICRTYQVRVKKEEPVYGLRKEINSENLIETQTDEFVALWKDMKSSSRLIDKVKYLVMPPGWNHVNGGETAKQIRRKALLENQQEAVGDTTEVLAPTSKGINEVPGH